MGDGVLADRDGRSLILVLPRLQRRAPQCANQVFAGDLGGRPGGFRGRRGLLVAALIDQRGVADRKHPVVAGLKVRFGVESVRSLILLKLAVGGRIPAGDTAGPHEHVVRHRFLAKVDGVLVDLGDEIAGEDLDIPIQQAFFERALHLGVVAREDLIEAFDQLDVDRGVGVIAVAGDLAGDLDARQPRAADQHLCRLGLGCLLAGHPNCLVDLAGVIEAFQRQRVFFEAVDPEEGGRAADRHEQVIVVDCLAVLQFECLIVGVDVGDAVADEVRRRRFDLVDRDRHLRFDLGVPDHAVGLV